MSRASSPAIASALRVLIASACAVGLLALILFATYFARFQNASKPTPASHVSELRAAAMRWKPVYDPSVCPAVADLIRDKELDPSFPSADPWGNPFGIDCNAGGVLAYSKGPDGKRGTADDIEDF